MEPMYYIGLDVHKRKISYCVKDSGGKIYRTSQNIAAKRHVSIQSELLNADAPADCDPEVRAMLADSCRKHGFHFLEMVSPGVPRFAFYVAHRTDRNALHSLPQWIQPSPR